MKFKVGDKVQITRYISQKNSLSEVATVIELTGHDLHPYLIEFDDDGQSFVTVAREDELELVCKS